MSRLFLSYSRHDLKKAERLHDWLGDLGYGVFRDCHPEDGIPGGADWEQELYRELRACHALVVLCSKNHGKSMWSFAEITHARAMGKPVFPVTVEECEIASLVLDRNIVDLTQLDLESLQPTDREDPGLVRLARGFAHHGLEPGPVGSWEGGSPYPGMLAYSEAEAPVFFGRDSEIRDARALLNRLRQFGGARWVLALGASGSGKSSLIRAGLVPRLRRDVNWLIVDPFRPEDDPFGSLAAALADSFARTEEGPKPTSAELRSRLDAGDVAELTAILKELAAAREAESPTALIVVDQLEELLGERGRADDQARAFTEFLARFTDAKPSAVVLGTLRSDFLGSFQRHPILGVLPHEEFSVPNLPVTAIGEIIRGPAEIAGLEVEDALVEAMVHDAETEDALPLIAFTLRELYEGYRKDGWLRRADYDDLGRLEGSVAKVAEAVLRDSSQDPNAQRAIQRSFLSLVRIAKDGKVIRWKAQRGALPTEALEALDCFRKARLLIQHGEQDSATLEVRHEALFRSWHTFSNWIRENRELVLLRSKLTTAALEFAERKDTENLWRGARLELMLDARRSGLVDFEPFELTYLDEAERKEAKEERERESARRRELEAALQIAETQRTTTRKLLYAAVVLLAAVIVVVLISLDRQQALNNEAKARQEAIAALTSARLATNRAELARQETIAALESANAATRKEEEARLESEELSYASEILVARSLLPTDRIEATRRVLNPARFPERLREFSWGLLHQWVTAQEWSFKLPERERPHFFQLSRDEGTLAVASRKMLWVLDPDSGELLASRRVEEPYRIGGVAVSPNGELIALATRNILWEGLEEWELNAEPEDPSLHWGEYVLLRVEDNSTIAKHPSDRAPNFLSFTEDGLEIIAGHLSGAWYQLSATDLETKRKGSFSSKKEETETRPLALSRDRYWVLNVDGEEVPEPRTIFEIPPPMGSPAIARSMVAAFSTRGRWLASASGNELRTYELAAGGSLSERLMGKRVSTGRVSAVAVSDNGWVATGGTDRAVLLWGAQQGDLRLALGPLEGSVHGLAIPADQETVLVGTSHRVVSLPRSVGKPRRLDAKGVGPIVDLAFSANSKHLASSGRSLLWDLTAPDRPPETLGKGTQATFVSRPREWFDSLGIGDSETFRLREIGSETLVTARAGAFSLHAADLVATSEDNALVLHSLTSGLPWSRLPGGRANRSAPEFSPRGRYVLAPGKPFVEFWNVETGQAELKLTGNLERVEDVTFSPSGDQLIAAGSNGVLSAWSWISGKATKQWEQRITRSGIRRVTFSMDGRTLALGCTEEAGAPAEIKLCDPRTGVERLSLRGHRTDVTALAFSPDGRWLASGDAEGVVQLWEASGLLPSIAASTQALLPPHRHSALLEKTRRLHHEISRLNEQVRDASRRTAGDYTFTTAKTFEREVRFIASDEGDQSFEGEEFSLRSKDGVEFDIGYADEVYYEGIAVIGTESVVFVVESDTIEGEMLVDVEEYDFRGVPLDIGASVRALPDAEGRARVEYTSSSLRLPDDLLQAMQDLRSLETRVGQLRAELDRAQARSAILRGELKAAQAEFSVLQATLNSLIDRD